MASRILLPVWSTLRPFTSRKYFQGVYSQIIILNRNSRILFLHDDQIPGWQGPVACYSSKSIKCSKSKSPSIKTYRPRIGGALGRVVITQKTDGKFVVNNSTGEETLEGRILELLNNIQIEEAVELFKNSSNTGKLPNANIVLQLIQKLAEHGNVETILELGELVLEKKLCSEMNYAKFLAMAYQESGSFEEAFIYLKINFEKNPNYSKIKNQFLFLTIFILRDFPDCHDHVINFVNYLKTSRGVSEIDIDLLKCYILTGKFKTAENFLDKNVTLMKKIPLVVSEILTILRHLQDVCDEEVIWRYFLEHGDKFGLKQKLLVIIYEYYLVCLCKKEKYSEVVKNLEKAKSNNIKIHRNNFVLIWRLLQDSDLSDEEMDVAGQIFNWYHEQYSK